MSTPLTTESSYDVIVVGAGSGGLTAAVGLSRFSKRVLLVEKGPMGGDCTNTGCIPSKSLLHLSQDVAQARNHNQEQLAETPTGSSVLERVRTRRDQLANHEVDEFGSMDGIELVFATATIVGPQRVELRAQTATGPVTVEVTAPNVVVSPGSKPRRIPVPGLPEYRYLTNEEIFELTDPPARLAIIGAGPVGLEMAVAFTRLGSDVVVLDAADQILPSLLPEAAKVLTEALTAQGIDLRPGLVAHGYDEATGTLAIGPLGAEPNDAISDVDAVLVAVGRIPNSKGMGLEDVGVNFAPSGHVEVDAKGRTAVDGLWAVGDVTLNGGTTHLANAWGRRLIQAIALPYLPLGDEPERPAVTYTKPEVATIGHQPTEAARDVIRITVDIAGVDRAYTDEVDHGILIVDVRRFTGKILGATIVGPRAGELITMFSLAMKADIAFHKWYGTVYPYPTYGDAISRAVDEYMSATMSNLPSQFGVWAGARVRSVAGRELSAAGLVGRVRGRG